MKLLKLFPLILIAGSMLTAKPVVYEGFNPEDYESGVRSGFLTPWHRLAGGVGSTNYSLLIEGFEARDGALLLKKKGEALSQLNVDLPGTFYGSYRVRTAKLSSNSVICLALGGTDASDFTPKTANFSIIVKGWRSDYGLVLSSGRKDKPEEGAPIQAKETYLVLYKVQNEGKDERQIESWILSTEQAEHFAKGEFTEAELNAAPLGDKAGEVMQRHSLVPKPWARISLKKGDFIACMSKFSPKTAFDEIRISTDSLKDAAGVSSSAGKSAQTESPGSAKKIIAEPALSSGSAPSHPNVLFITMDDMNYDSIGSYGCKIPNISPHIDRLAEQGVRFEYAYNQTSSCAPSRNAYQNGRYPHVSGNLSFFNVDPDFRPLPQVLKESGYFTACINKPRDSSINNDYNKYWDHHVIMTGATKRHDAQYAEHFEEALNIAKNKKQPFYCVVNIADPHKPFFNDPKSIEKGFDSYGPSVEFTVNDVSIPAFLPEHPEIHEEMRNYYNSVKRGDDCVGAVMNTLNKSGLAENTVVILISDHGMPLPFAKSSLYPDGLRTPWIVKWPGKAKPGSIDSKHLVSAIDFMPTVLDITGIPHPAGIQGKSTLDLIQGKDTPMRDYVYAEFNDNAGGLSFPMRAVHTKDFVYVFNAWATGENKFRSAATWHKSEGVMKRMSKSDPEVAKRYNHLTYRCVEEFYDLRKDPHALVNQIDAPEHQERIKEFRNKLSSWMKNTDDYVLEAFAVRNDIEKLKEIYAKYDAEALKRAKTLQWKRYKNRAGGTGKNMRLYRL